MVLLWRGAFICRRFGTSRRIMLRRLTLMLQARCNCPSATVLTSHRFIHKGQCRPSSDTQSMAEASQNAVFLGDSGRMFLQTVHDLMVDETLEKGTDRNRKILEYKTPEQLKADIDFSISESGLDRGQTFRMFEETVSNSVQSAHPRYFNQFYSGRTLEGLAAAWLVESLNCNVHTYECGPVFTLAEQQAVKEVCKKIGYSDGSGVFMPGGSLCNIGAIHLARFKKNNNVKTQGLCGQPRQIIFCTADAHYSISKAAHFLGFGTDSIVHVATDEIGRMIPSDLEAKMKQCEEKGEVPMCTVSTCGTTVLASYDKIHDIADVCQRHACWLHVDSCWGGGALFSDNYKSLLDGVERSDSVAISFHKMMGAQLQCSAVLVKDKNNLMQCNSIVASYLFQEDKDYYESQYDIGTYTVQCGRKADGYKLWALWKVRGHAGMQAHVDRAFDNAKYFTERIRSTEGFRLVLPKFQYLNICFWYIPPRLRGQKETPEWWQEVGKVAPQIKSRMVHSGTLAIGYQPLESKGLVNFFRIVIENPLQTHEDMDFAIQEIDRLGRDL